MNTFGATTHYREKMFNWIKKLFGAKTTPTSLDALPAARFGGHEFRVRESDVSGGNGRTLQGRRLYSVKLTANAKDITNDQLAKLRKTFEDGKACELIVPTLGTINAKCTQWEEAFRTDRTGTFSAQFIETIPGAA